MVTNWWKKLIVQKEQEHWYQIQSRSCWLPTKNYVYLNLNQNDVKNL